MLQGKIGEECESENYHDDMFGVDVYSCVNEGDFIQKVKLKAAAEIKMSGTVEFIL